MKAKMLFTLLLTMMGGAVIAADAESTMTLDDAQQATGESAENVIAADANGDGLIDTVEFAALTTAEEKTTEGH
ncbi:hypothetical protein MNBD_GAMMA13-2056 [hydrothermal vent metagenome]|uniref:EF-hand domain-containing protein n=1 Tax=hydrothermal vent metagenome TaxID=652676 RepID=A0A3B0YX78_9ZZZZ